MKKAALLIIVFLSANLYSQGSKTYFPIWTFQEKDVTINGISVGLWSFGNVPRNTNTNGIKLELIGVGLLVPLIPHSPIPETEEGFEKLEGKAISEHINGLNLSASGTVCDCVTNGISLGFMGQIQYKVNGISGSVMNFTQVNNGIQLGMFNESFKMRGIQIGFFNESKSTRGIQIGLLNKNEKRKFPIINWNFR